MFDQIWPGPKVGIIYRIIVLVLLFSLLLPGADMGARAQAPQPPENLFPYHETYVSATGYQNTDYPYNLKAEPVGIPVFKWDSAPEATQYRFQISGDPGFPGTPPINITTANTSYTPVALTNTVLTDGEWYWRVRVEKPVASPYSDPQKFVKGWGSPDNTPELTAPIEDTYLEFFDRPAFEWKPVVGAAAYRIQIATSDTSFATPVYNQVTLKTSHQPASKLLNAEYYWRVIPLDAAGNLGTASTPRRFVMSYGQKDFFPGGIPALLEPENNATPNFTPTFKWEAVRGAEYYILQYTSAPGCNFGSALTVSVTTRSTDYTPTKTLPNDVEYCWHVRAQSGQSSSDWSSEWKFTQHWYMQPELLTPTTNYQYVRYPFFSWSPVPGARQYKIEISTTNSFPPVNPGWSELTTNTFYQRPDKGLSGTYFWRVTPIDADNLGGKPSEVSSFNAIQTQPGSFPVPQLLYPFYYYTPSGYLNIETREDRTVTLPVFMWHRTLDGREQTDIEAYRLQVATASTFAPGTIMWEVDTENLSAAPISTDAFRPSPGTDYFWRVCSLTAIGENCINNLMWSQVWKTRIDPSKGLTPTSGGSPVLLRPEHTYEMVESMPLLEWYPLQEAAEYVVQISTDPAFPANSKTLEETVPYPAYTPRSDLNYYPGLPTDLPYGTYYWRVRDRDKPEQWSDAWRFQVAAQSHWKAGRALGSPTNRSLFGFDKVEEALPNGFDLSSIYGTQSRNYWHFGFNASALNADVTYALYLDIDKKDDSGGWVDPRGFNIGTIGAHRPEYAVYFDKSSLIFSSSPMNVEVYQWNSAANNWNSPVRLIDIGGDLFPSTIYTVSSEPDGKAFAGGSYGTTLHGSTTGWEAQPSPQTVTYLGSDSYCPGANECTRWMVGAGGVIVRGGSTTEWYETDSGTTNQINDVEISAGTVFAAGLSRTILRWNPVTEKWVKESFANPTEVYDMYSISMVGLEGWAVGADGIILKRDTSDSNKWKKLTSPTTKRLNSIENFDIDSGWAVGNDGTILKRSGADWTQVSLGLTTNHLYSVSLTSATSGWAVGGNGTILRLVDDTWSVYNLDPQLSNDFYAVDMLNESYGWITGSRGTNLLWNGASWVPVQDPIGDYFELLLPDLSIGMQADTGSAAVAFFSANRSTYQVLDTIPDNPTNTMLERFTQISERMSASIPPTNITGDPTTFSSVPPFLWHWPKAAEWEGYRIELARDADFSLASIVYTYDLVAKDPYLAAPVHATLNDVMGDNTYYWRVRPQYYHPTINLGGAWSIPGRIERLGFVPKKLNVSTVRATPTFTWDRVEGTQYYEIEVSNSPNFGTTVIKVSTPNISYTHTDTLPNGTYYWRVLARRFGSNTIRSGWSETKTFVLSLPTPSGSRVTGAVVSTAPTMCWDPLIEMLGERPVLAAWKYRVQVSKDANFTTIFDTIDTEQNCWTPTKGYDDIGTYHWRVAMMDGKSRLSEYSVGPSFFKKYPFPDTLRYLSYPPTFSWNPVPGAARYKIEISLYSSFSPIYETATTAAASYTPTKAIDPSKNYYWRVAMIDYDKKQGAFTGSATLAKNLYLPVVRK